MNDLFGKVRRRKRKGTRHAGTMAELLRQLAAKGVTLEACCDPRLMDRSAYTLKKYARRFRIRFPDYVPAKMRRRAARSARGSA